MSTASWLEGFRPSDHWRTRIATRGPGLLVGVLALALAVQLALLVTDLAGGGAPLPALPRWQAHARGPDLAALLSSHLFGTAPHSAGSLAEDAPQTSLPLVLTGVIAGNDPSAGVAILGPSPQAARVYAVGDRVPGGATLAAVLAQKVLLRQNGALQSLPLPRQEAETGAPPDTAALAPEQTAAPQFAARMRSLVARRPQILAELLRPEPVFSGGHQLGYRVYPGSNPAAFARLGLKPGDLVLDINGTPLNDPTQDQQILATLGDSSEATVTVLRGGQQRVLTLNLAQVEQAAQSLTRQPAAPPAAPAPTQPFGALLRRAPAPPR
ncbi:MAG: type II secretion system protein GspC [Steroidobacteraceae bacterium]